MRSALVFDFGVGVLQVACGPGLAPSTVGNKPVPVRAGIPPASDEAGFRKMLSGEVTSGGLWFADPNCQTQFGQSGAVSPDTFDAFARCVATVHLRPTGRTHWLDDTSVLTDDAGFEIEAHVVNGRLDYIGFSGRAPGMPDLPTITPEALEALRVSGDSKATITADQAKDIVMVLPGNPNPTHTEHLRLCLSEAGELTKVMAAEATTPESLAAFTALTRDWKFRPFVAAGKPTAVCAIVSFQYPATATPERHLPRPPQVSKAGNFVYNVRPAELQKLRLTGSNLVVPDDQDKVGLSGQRLVGSFKLCLNEAGQYEQGTLLKSTGVPGYDAKIARAMMSWTYRPYLVDGKAVPVCTAVTFIYTQR